MADSFMKHKAFPFEEIYSSIYFFFLDLPKPRPVRVLKVNAKVKQTEAKGCKLSKIRNDSLHRNK